MPFRFALAAVVASLAVPVTASATLVYQKGFAKPSVWVANDDGSGKHEFVKRGVFPTITQDGAAVVYGTLSGHLREVPIGGGESKTLIERWDYGLAVVSDDGRYVAGLGATDSEDASRLVLVDRTTGARRTLARGQFGGFSFSPESDRLVYALTAREQRPTRGDLSIASGDLLVAPVARGASVAITSNGSSAGPVWGPERIAYSRVNRVRGRPRADLLTLLPDGTDRRLLAENTASEPSGGLFGIDWSAAGDQLLAASFTEDSFSAVAIDPSGDQRRVSRPSLAVLPVALSRDATTILAYTNPFLDTRPDVITIQYAGGAPTVLVRNALYPSWNR